MLSAISISTNTRLVILDWLFALATSLSLFNSSYHTGAPTLDWCGEEGVGELVEATYTPSRMSSARGGRHQFESPTGDRGRNLYPRKTRVARQEEKDSYTVLLVLKPGTLLIEELAAQQARPRE